MIEARYLKPDLPDVFEVFVPSATEPDIWVQYGIYQSVDFSPVEDEPFALVNTVSGTPFFLRVIEVKGDVFSCVDGGGEKYVIRIIECDLNG